MFFFVQLLIRKQAGNCRVQQCRLHTAHCTLHTAHCTLHTAHFYFHFHFVIKKVPFSQNPIIQKPETPSFSSSLHSCPFPKTLLFPPILLSCLKKITDYDKICVPHFSCMENQRSPLLNWVYFSQEKSMEELTQSLLYTTLELEQTRVAVQEELRKRDDQILYLEDLLNKTIGEREEAQEKCNRLLVEKLLLQHQQHQHQQTAPLSGISSIEDEPRRGIDSNNGLSSSECEESIVSSPVLDSISQPHVPPSSSVPQQPIELEPDKPLPQKGKLLQAVMNAGPLLQTLLLAGPLPQWRHPPPPLESFDIPPVTIPSPPPQQLIHQDSFANMNNFCINPISPRVNRKRVLCENSDPPPEHKYQRIGLH